DDGIHGVIDVAEAAGGTAAIDQRHGSLPNELRDLGAEVFRTRAVDGGGAHDGHRQAAARDLPDTFLSLTLGAVVGQADIGEGMGFVAGNDRIAIDVGDAHVEEPLKAAYVPGGVEELLHARDINNMIDNIRNPVCGASDAVIDVND